MRPLGALTLNTLNSGPSGRLMTPEENTIFENRRTDLLAKLLYAIAGFLGYSMSEIDLKNGGYAPIGWKSQDDRLAAIHTFAENVARGRGALPVFAVQNPPTGGFSGRADALPDKQ